MENKNCSRCKKFLPVSSFSKSNKEKSGLRSRCIVCEKTLYREKHPFKEVEIALLPNEIFKDVVGYEEYYTVSNYGRMCTKDRYKPTIAVNGTKYTQFIKGKLKTITLSKHPKALYLQVLLAVGNDCRTFKVHRLVAQAFIPNPENKPEINHIDGNKLNNHVNNLEWCTRLENMQHAFKSGLIPDALRGEECNFSKLTEQEVLEIRKINKSKPLKEIARNFDTSITNVSDILNRKIWTHI